MHCRIGTLSTVASDGAASGFPSGSVVEYAPDEKGRPIFMLSSISPHTKHLRKDSRCSFTVLAPAFRVRAHHNTMLFKTALNTKPCQDFLCQQLPKLHLPNLPLPSLQLPVLHSAHFALANTAFASPAVGISCVWGIRAATPCEVYK